MIYVQSSSHETPCVFRTHYINRGNYWQSGGQKTFWMYLLNWWESNIWLIYNLSDYRISRIGRPSIVLPFVSITCLLWQCLLHSLLHNLLYSPLYSPLYSLLYSFLYSLLHSLVHSLVQSSAQSAAESLPCTLECLASPMGKILENLKKYQSNDNSWYINDFRHDEQAFVQVMPMQEDNAYARRCISADIYSFEIGVAIWLSGLHMLIRARRIVHWSAVFIGISCSSGYT